MNIIIRVDSGSIIGTGHIMRCLNLMENFKDNNINFVCREHQGNRIDIIEQIYNVYRLKYINDTSWLGCNYIDDANEVIKITKNYSIIDLLIIDHYAIDFKWETILRPYVNKIFVIDDLANRNHNCDVLLDYNITEYDYTKLVPKKCELLIGLKHIIFNEDIYKYRDQRYVKTKVNRIHICFGGIDQYNIADNIVNYLVNYYDENIIIDVICSQIVYDKWHHKKNNINVYKNLPKNKYLELLFKSDIVIGASGTGIYERCYLGIPSIIITIADNQLGICNKIVNNNCGIYIGHYNDYDIDIDKISDILKNIDINMYSNNCIKMFE